jgi:hypothetical protein
MASIIAQLVEANRKRKKRQRETKEIHADKCVYKLPPFDPCFIPEKHNKYLRSKYAHERKNIMQEKAKGIGKG